MKTVKAYNEQLTGSIEIVDFSEIGELLRNLPKEIEKNRKKRIKESVKFLEESGYIVKRRKSGKV